MDHERAAVLDGGWEAWVAAGAPVTAEAPRIEPRAFAGAPRDAHVDAGYVESHLNDPAVLVLDARAPERFRGESEPIDPVAGHIPGAVNMPYTAGPPAVDPDAEVAVYCGSGITAAVTILGLERAGVAARLYPGSWSEWSSRGLAVERG